MAIPNDAENVCAAYPCGGCMFNEMPKQYNPVCAVTGARGLPREIGGEKGERAARGEAVSVTRADLRIARKAGE